MAADPVRKRLAAWLRCDRCGLARFRKQVVLGRGTAPAEILFIGEAPGRSEDLRGEAFVGRAGGILNAALDDAARMAGRGCPPSYYVTNTVACIPLDERGGAFREPKPPETAACWERVRMTAALVDPEHVVLLGTVAKDAVGARFPGALALRHPAYILRQGGTGSTEYRSFVRELADLFRKGASQRLAPLDVFGDEIRPPVDHADHGRGTESGPDDPDCGCRMTPDEAACAAAGCGFCAARAYPRRPVRKGKAARI